jgi:hypothetical protein
MRSLADLIDHFPTVRLTFRCRVDSFADMNLAASPETARLIAAFTGRRTERESA